jgi:hypothetical protein
MAQIPEGCKRIEIHNNLKAEENYKLSGRLLTGHGWGIDYANSELFTIRTNKISIDRTHVYYNIACRDSTILIYGMALRTPVDPTDRDYIVPVENSRGMTKAPLKTFHTMVEISDYFQGTKTYTIYLERGY